MLTFQQWLKEFVGPVTDDMTNSNPAFAAQGVKSKYRAMDGPQDRRKKFDPQKKFLGVPEEKPPLLP
jgi:hypothetical protein